VRGDARSVNTTTDNVRGDARSVNTTTDNVGGDTRFRGEKLAILVHHDHSNAVVNVKHARVRRVMRRSPSVAPDGPRGLSAEQIDSIWHGHTDRTKVVVVTEPPHLPGGRVGNECDCDNEHKRWPMKRASQSEHNQQ
jgi:hypothetical protein